MRSPPCTKENSDSLLLSLSYTIHLQEEATIYKINMKVQCSRGCQSAQKL